VAVGGDAIRALLKEDAELGVPVPIEDLIVLKEFGVGFKILGLNHQLHQVHQESQNQAKFKMSL
jgi:hypothetical protein